MLLEKSAAKLAVFDLDHTILRANASYCFGRYLYQKKAAPLVSILRSLMHYSLHKVKIHSVEQVHQIIFQLIFFGRCAITMQKLAYDFFQGSLDRLLDPVILKIIQDLKNKGVKIVLLSASPDFLVEPIAEKLQLDDWQASRYDTDRQQLFYSMSNVMTGQKKAEWMNRYRERFDVQKKDVAAFTDSLHDLPMLEAAGEPYGVNPDLGLRAACKRNGWKILRTELRDDCAFSRR